jgi:hypothetical protein
MEIFDTYSREFSDLKEAQSIFLSIISCICLELVESSEFYDATTPTIGWIEPLEWATLPEILAPLIIMSSFTVS